MFEIRSIKPSYFSGYRSFSTFNNKRASLFNNQIRSFSRQYRYSVRNESFYLKFGKPTLFTFGGIGGMLFSHDSCVLCIVFYSLAMIISEERTKYAMKKFPAFFKRGMRQLEFGGSYFFRYLFIFIQ